MRDVVRVEERFFDQSAYVSVLRQVKDAVPVTTCPPQPGKAELGQVLGHRSGLKRYIRLQPVHEMLPGWVGTPASGR